MELIRSYLLCIHADIAHLKSLSVFGFLMLIEFGKINRIITAFKDPTGGNGEWKANIRFDKL